MKKLLAPLLLVFVTACTTVPSFNDTNQSYASVDIQYAVHSIDCEKEQLPQVQRVINKIDWFKFYSTNKGGQTDVLDILSPIEQTATEWKDRATQKEPSVGFCKLKKTLMLEQTQSFSQAVIRRF